MYWLLALCALFGVLATVEDLWRRKVSNPIAVAAFLSGIGARSILYGFYDGTLDALLGSLLGFAVFLVFYLLGGMGGGDIKLMAGFGAIVGKDQIILAAIMAALVGAVMALLFLIVRAVMGKFGPQTEGAGSALKSSIPYAPAITAGVLLSFLSEGELWTNV